MSRTVSILICTRDRAGSLQETLHSIGQAVIPDGWDVELLVIDNGSSDHTLRVVESFGGTNGLAARHVLEPRKGKGFAYNTGISASSGQVLLWTDDDVRVPPGWIDGMCRPILEGQADAVQGGVAPAAHLERPWLKGIYRAALAIVDPLVGSTPESLVGANMAFGRHVLTRVNGFKTELGPGAAGLGDDTLWGLELRNAGFRILYAFDATVEHHFDPDRLNEGYFKAWAQKSGRSMAMIDVKWFQRAPRHPRRLLLLTAFKYGIRRAIDWRRVPVPPEWVMYYQMRKAYAAGCIELLRSGS